MKGDTATLGQKGRGIGVGRSSRDEVGPVAAFSFLSLVPCPRFHELAGGMLSK